ncbi:hypothetical protein LEMA_P088360.1 [Plenodomus lingam JN3]|uniref:Uncharacterized protein n=1 Tax=Leptosphaeria maculans (strain JN3 / isolate v23.1.3 / race Av1-4-5-6-7-8) TaxID=985895 RepID=E5A7K2_LEPMJ|nr:hypothetical protein LEMA_P088360.1 [Plenodomus lingam JN3]CBX99597.1 hypothetical protein LEMA_P088360.1 [Plenodomus lingam JN3]
MPPTPLLTAEPETMQAVGGLQVQTGLPLTPPGSSIVACGQSNDEQHETKLQKWWDHAIAKHMDLPDGYRDVHVLMVKWEDSIDQLNVRPEVDALASIFKDVFLFDVREVQLGPKKSQHQLDKEIASWVFDKDSVDGLLIVYYAGHGVYDEKTKALEICPDNLGTYQNVSWTRSEKPFIETVQADVFLIMDCCYASDMLRNVAEVGRTFEMLAASHIGQTTCQPGPNSFTNSLIKHLKELAGELTRPYFTTLDIHQRMQRERDEPPAFWRRLSGSDRHIRLRKLKPKHERPAEDETDRLQYSRFLHLGFALKSEEFDKSHIEILTRKLPKLFERAKIPVVDIRWLGCRKVSSSRLREVVEMYMVKSRGDLSAVSPTTGRKRAADEADLGPGGRTSHKRGRVSLVQDSSVDAEE